MTTTPLPASPDQPCLDPQDPDTGAQYRLLQHAARNGHLLAATVALFDYAAL
ncbi:MULTISPECIES: hypothetical protein [Streptomyces]|uniref:Uncharacterized protein n=2 Tax=Streptomyces rimosus subsp. rimosus TaxID=132474 RepID=A0A8A1V0K5_STRR1|nr:MULTISPECIES: hypothetical protein [Streptomyces]MYT47922.1 hypothetical protein [Streptomyces sp. SID5471]QGY69145.1 hypothetical protein V519_027560 [Streptomyces rimosus R6-500]QST85558.1 hypothetical protein SRIM_040470 [Streptomyces rimosus subsp. rimosus ATCC 10970]UNZ00527.1 hypothetical protein SRIMR7_00070 [Streptomyces rimosus subsp. rimosus]UTH92511.1 hypothetical protein SRIMHP_00070 [Streptomyces rimosus subsp. rimosus]